MDDVRTDERDDSPGFGARARAWRRFERDLGEWLDSPAGRFAQWRAQQAVGAPAAVAGEPPRG
jgi:hypothetical protein